RLEQPEPRRAYLFKHNITQEVVYQTLLTDQRQELHLAVARTIEGLQPDNVEDLALHYYNSDMQQAPVRSKALHYLDAAGLRAKHDYANETALSYFNRALDVEERAAWLKAKVEVLHILGRREEEAATLRTLTQQATPEQFDLALLWGEYYEAVSDYAQAQSAVKQALGLAQSTTDQEGQARCLARLGMIAWRQGEYDAAERLYGEALIMVEGQSRYRSVEAEIRYGLGLVYRQQGKFDEARVAFERDLTLNQQIDNRQYEARALNALGIIEQTRRNFHEAIHYYRQALTIREQIGDRAGVGASLLNIAQNLSTVGNHSDAELMLRDALRTQQILNNQWWQAIILNELGILYLTVGNLAESQKALELGLTLDQEGIEAYLLCNLGQVLRDSGEWRKAEEVLQEGLTLAQTQGDTHLEAIYLNDLALVSLRMQKFDEAFERAQLSLEKFQALQLNLSITSDLSIMATAQLAMKNRSAALTIVANNLQILDNCDGEGPDFPQRDYLMCYQVLQALGETTQASHALKAAHRLLMRQAERISDLDMRRSYLENVAYNHSILQAVNRNRDG
ncbi:MAG: tetratricopeptide repeat protein, partial [Microbacteriaceae bacterium]|nr:tetratricopeptide repeat protein [Microbacteriaceae bacterium]